MAHRRRKKKRKKQQPAPPAPEVRGKPPWHPLHLMVLCALPWSAIGGVPVAVVGSTLLFIPLALIASSVFAAINWNRLGNPGSARGALGILALGLLLPLVPILVYGMPPLDSEAGSSTIRYTSNLNYFTNMLTPFIHLHLQRGAFDDYAAASGQHSSVLPLWLVNLPAGFFAVFVWLSLFAGPPQ